MSELYEKLDATVSQAILGSEKKSPEEIRILISMLNAAVVNGAIDPVDLEKLARSIEALPASPHNGAGCLACHRHGRKGSWPDATQTAVTAVAPAPDTVSRDP